MANLINVLFRSFSPWIRQFLFGTAVKKAGRGVLGKTPFEFHAPNLLVTGLVICGLNAIGFMVMLFFKGRTAPALVSSGIVTLVTAYFIIQGIGSKRAVKEHIVLSSVLVAFFGIFVFFLLVIDLWWLAFIAKLTLEVLLCYAIMLTRNSKADDIQSKAISYIAKTLKISPDGRTAKLLSKLDSNEQEANQNGTK